MMSSPLTARVTLLVVVFLSVVLLATMVYAATHGPVPPTVIDDCALVLTRSGHECR